MKNIIFGTNTIIETIKNTRRIKEVYLLSENPVIEKLCKDNKIKLQFKRKEFFYKISKSTQGVAALAEPFSYQNIDIIKQLDPETSILILDRIQDPQNFGAIIRTAAAANFRAIIISKNNQVEVTATVEKVAVGAANHIPIIKVGNISKAIETIKKDGFWVVGTGLTPNSQDYREIDYTGKIAVVVGSEGPGVRRLVLENCDHIVKLPINYKVESLNVSVATGIICYYIYDVKNPFE